MGPQALRMNLNTLLRHEVFSVEQLSSTVSEAGTNFTSDKRLRKSFYKLLITLLTGSLTHRRFAVENSSGTSTLLRT